MPGSGQGPQRYWSLDDMAREAASVRAQEVAQAKASVDPGHAVARVDQLPNGNWTITSEVGVEQFAFAEEARYHAKALLEKMGGGRLLFRAAEGEWTSTRVGARTVAEKAQPEPAPPPLKHELEASETPTDAESPKPPAVTGPSHHDLPVAQPAAPDVGAPNSTPEENPLTLRTARIPDVLEPDEISFVIRTTALRRDAFDFGNYRLRRAGNGLIGVERAVGDEIWVHSYIIDRANATIVLSSLGPMLDPYWEMYLSEPIELARALHARCPVLLQSLATRAIPVKTEDDAFSMLVRPPDVQTPSTYVLVGLDRSLGGSLEEQILVLADLTAQACLQIVKELAFATTMTETPPLNVANWLHTIGQGADSVKKVLDLVSAALNLFPS